MIMASNVLSTFRLNLDFNEVKNSKRKINRYGVYVIKKKIRLEGPTVISHVNSNRSNNLNAPNNDNLIVTPNLPHSNV